MIVHIHILVTSIVCACLCFYTFSDVEIEEVTVENGLHDASHDSDDVEAVLVVVPVDPVEDVQAAVRAQSKQVVAGDGFRLTCLTDHKQLRQNGYGLQVDGEGPQHLRNKL